MNSEFMKQAVDEALRGVREGHGGPFGAVVVCKGEVIARGHNRVVQSNDPTAHAEIVALRAASKKLGRFDLSDCVIYTSCEPCPMCLAAIHWAKMERCYYGCTAEDAAAVGFDDKFIHDVLCGRAKKRQVRMTQLARKECLEPFERWVAKEDRVKY